MSCILQNYAILTVGMLAVQTLTHKAETTRASVMTGLHARRSEVRSGSLHILWLAAKGACVRIALLSLLHLLQLAAFAPIGNPPCLDNNLPLVQCWLRELVWQQRVKLPVTMLPCC